MPSLRYPTSRNPAELYRPGSIFCVCAKWWARSAKIAEQNLDTTPTPEKPSTTLLRIVDKIIASPRPNQPEKAHISVGEGPTGCRDLCIENILTDENGDDMKLNKGA